MLANRKVLGLGHKLKATVEQRLAIPAGTPEDLKNFLLYECPTNLVLRQKTVENSTFEQMAAWPAVYRERIAKRTTETYGPSHPQSWENLYGNKLDDWGIPEPRQAVRGRRYS